LPNTMKSPSDKAAGYTVVIIIIAIVLGFVIGLITAAITGTGAWMSGAFNNTSQESDVQFDKDSSLGKLEQWSKNVEKAGKQMEAAEKAGDQNAQADAFKNMMGAALGGGAVESLAPDRLKPFLPETLMGLPRGNLSAERSSAMGVQTSEASAAYTREDGHSITLQITDTGSAKGLLGLASWAGVEGERQTDNGYEKTYREDGRLIHEERNGSHGEYTVVLGDRFTVHVNGDDASIDDLKAALSDVDLSALEALKNEGVKAN
jgi:hypothetical protein